MKTSATVLLLGLAAAALAESPSPTSLDRRDRQFAARYQRVSDWADQLGLSSAGAASGYGAAAASPALADHLAYGRLALAIKHQLAATAPTDALLAYYRSREDRYRLPDEIVGEWAVAEATTAASANRLAQEAVAARNLSPALAHLSAAEQSAWTSMRRPLTPGEGDRDNADLWDVFDAARRDAGRHRVLGPIRLGSGHWCVIVVERFARGSLPPFAEIEPRVRRDYAAWLFESRLSSPSHE